MRREGLRYAFFFRCLPRQAANPTRPVPRSSRADGSGTPVATIWMTAESQQVLAGAPARCVLDARVLLDGCKATGGISRNQQCRSSRGIPTFVQLVYGGQARHFDDCVCIRVHVLLRRSDDKVSPRADIECALSDDFNGLHRKADVLAAKYRATPRAPLKAAYLH